MSVPASASEGLVAIDPRSVGVNTTGGVLLVFNVEPFEEPIFPDRL